MLPIVRFPRIVEQPAPWFDPVFATDEQRKHFREYVTGLIAGDEATVTAINNLFLACNDQSALNKFLTQIEAVHKDWVGGCARRSRELSYPPTFNVVQHWTRSGRCDILTFGET